MKKIKMFIVGVWFSAHSVVAAPSQVLASNKLETWLEDNVLIIAIVSAGAVALEKILEKVYNYCVLKHNQASRAEQVQTTGEQEDVTAIATL